MQAFYLVSRWVVPGSSAFSNAYALRVYVLFSCLSSRSEKAILGAILGILGHSLGATLGIALTT